MVKISANIYSAAVIIGLSGCSNISDYLEEKETQEIITAKKEASQIDCTRFKPIDFISETVEYGLEGHAPGVMVPIGTTFCYPEGFCLNYYGLDSSQYTTDDLKSIKTDDQYIVFRDTQYETIENLRLRNQLHCKAELPIKLAYRHKIAEKYASKQQRNESFANMLQN